MVSNSGTMRQRIAVQEKTRILGEQIDRQQILCRSGHAEDEGTHPVELDLTAQSGDASKEVEAAQRAIGKPRKRRQLRLRAGEFGKNPCLSGAAGPGFTRGDALDLPDLIETGIDRLGIFANVETGSSKPEGLGLSAQGLDVFLGQVRAIGGDQALLHHLQIAHQLFGAVIKTADAPPPCWRVGRQGGLQLLQQAARVMAKDLAGIALGNLFRPASLRHALRQGLSKIFGQGDRMLGNAQMTDEKIQAISIALQRGLAVAL